MAWFAAAAAAAASLGSAYMNSQSGEKETEPYMGNSSGNVTDQRPPIPETQEKETSMLGKTNKFLTTPVGDLTAKIGGQFLGDYRTRRANKNRYKDLKSEGLTAQEIAGGSSGGSIQSSGNTLGSGPSQLAKSQQDFQAGQAQLDRDAKQKIAETTSAPAKSQANTAIERLRMDESVNYAKIDQITETTRKLNLENSNFWSKLAAQMGPENIKASLAMYKHGIDFKTMLQALDLPSPEDAKKLELIFDQLHKGNSLIRREYEGLVHGITNTADKIWEHGTELGKQLKIKAKQTSYKSRHPKITSR